MYVYSDVERLCFVECRLACDETIKYVRGAEINYILKMKKIRNENLIKFRVD